MAQPLFRGRLISVQTRMPQAKVLTRGERSLYGVFTRLRLELKLRNHLQRLGLWRADDERRYGRLVPRCQPVANALLRSDERHRIDELVRNRSDCLALVAAEIE